MQSDWFLNSSLRLSRGFPESMVIVDCETTGGNAVRHRIIEVAAILVEGGEVVESWQSLCNPGRSVPENIQRLTGILPEMLRDAPSFSDICHELSQLVRGRVFVAHNARFDFSFLKNEFEREGINFTPKPLCSVRFLSLIHI